jgi:hypothetical protein
MATIDEIERLALGLPEPDRAVLVTTLLGSLSPILDEDDDGLAEALRRDGELEAGEVSGVTIDELDGRVAARRPR